MSESLCWGIQGAGGGLFVPVAGLWKLGVVTVFLALRCGALVALVLVLLSVMGF